jgi:phosphatidate cytidylyltransferase
VWLFGLLLLPAFGATCASIAWIAHGVLDFAPSYLGLLVSGIALTCTHVVVGRNDLEKAAQLGSRLLPAFVLVSLCGSQLIPLAAHSRGIQILWWVIGTVAINDAAAYFVGRSIGRIKMAPALSPNKSIEGSIAGVAFGVIAGVPLWYSLVGIPLGWASCVALTVLAIIGGQAADLSKSYVKRLCGVKDTGAFFPGHGGVLDRFDGAIGAAPFLLVCLYFTGSL